MYDFDRRHPLLEESINTTIAEIHGGKNIDLMFRFLKGVFTNSAGQVDHMYRLEVSDNSDSYFLYVFDVLESEYHILKNSLRLHQDFIQFPEILITAMKKCMGIFDPNEQDEAKYYMTIEVRADGQPGQDGKLTVVQKNRHKETDYLVLDCAKGNDGAIKMYLSSRLGLALAQLNERSTDRDGLRMDKARLEKQVADLISELAETKESSKKRLDDMAREHKDAMHEAKTSADNMLSETKREYELAASEARNHSDREKSGLNETIDKLRSDFTGVENLLRTTESHLLETRHKLDVAVGERDRYMADVSVLTAENKERLDEIAALNKTIDAQLHKIESLAERNVIKDEKVGDLSGLVKKNDAVVDDLRAQLRGVTNRWESQKDKNGKLKEEIKRLGDVNGSLEATVRDLEERIATKNDIMRKQEAVINEKQRDIEALKDSLRESRDETQKTQGELSQARAAIDGLERDLAKTRDELASSKNTCDYLNAQMNQQQLGGVFTPFVAAPAAASSSATAAAAAPPSAAGTPSGLNEYGTYIKSTAVHTPSMTKPIFDSMMTSQHYLQTADGFLQNTPTALSNVRGDYMRGRDGLASHRESASAQSNRTSLQDLRGLSHALSTPQQSGGGGGVGLHQIDYYNTEARSATSQREKSDRSPPAKVIRQSQQTAYHTVTPMGGAHSSLTTDMLTSEEVFVRERSSAKSHAAGKINAEAGSYEWNKSEYA